MERDVVFCLAPDVRRVELQYALRSLNFVPHGRVFLIGGRPDWVVNVEHVSMPRVDKWVDLTRVWDVIRTLPLTAEFIYSEDDYFITEPVDDIPNYHQGPLADRVDKSVKRITPSWRGSLKASYDLLVANGIPDPLSFDVHIPMVVESDRIPTWKSKYVLRYRDLIGNTATRRPVKVVRDVKCSTESAVKKVQAAGVGFLSSSDRTFVKSGVKAVVDQIHPEPCRYEKEFYMDASPFEPESAYDQPIAPSRFDRIQAKKARIVERRIPRNGPVKVKLETGEWVDEESLADRHPSSELAGDLTEEE